MKEEAELLPQLETLLKVYEAAWTMAEAQDYHRDMKEPPKKDTTQPLF